MPIARVASLISALGVNGGTSSAIDTTGANLLVVGVVRSTVVYGITDNKGNAWQTAAAFGSGSHYLFLYYCLNPVVGSGHTFTVAGAGAEASVVAAAYSGVYTRESPSYPVSRITPSTTSYSFAPEYPADDLALFVSVISGLATSPTVSGGALTVRQQLNGQTGAPYMLAFADEIQAASTAVGAAWSWTGTSVVNGCIGFFEADRPYTPGYEPNIFPSLPGNLTSTSFRPAFLLSWSVPGST